MMDVEIMLVMKWKEVPAMKFVCFSTRSDQCDSKMYSLIEINIVN